jgi:hypothetical protein
MGGAIMLIWRNSGRLTALVAALTLVACGGSQPPGAGGGPCNYDQLQKGCVGLLNFYSGGPAEIDGVRVPAPTVANNLKTPGTTTVMVTNTSVSSSTSFQATVNGAQLSVSCTVTSLGWVDVNPGVVVQPSGILSCINW